MNIHTAIQWEPFSTFHSPFLSTNSHKITKGVSGTLSKGKLEKKKKKKNKKKELKMLNKKKKKNIFLILKFNKFIFPFF